jgi:uncharacterized protein (TIGR00730 family)
MSRDESDREGPIDEYGADVDEERTTTRAFKAPHMHTPVHAFENPTFLHGPDARPLRILSEYLEPAARLRREKIRDTIVFFGSARINPKAAAETALEEVRRELEEHAAPDESLAAKLRRAERFCRLAEYYDDAYELSRRITEWSKSLTGSRHFVVASGGGGGIMQAVNHGAAAANGKSVGFNISLPFEQTANEYITRHLIFDFHYFFMRKFWFVYLAKAIVVFPGGFGTLDEMMEVLTLIQTKKPRKTMPIVLYGGDYWKSVINFDELVEWGTISPEDLDLFRICDRVDDAFDYIRARLEELYLEGKKGLNEVKVT